MYIVCKIFSLIFIVNHVVVIDCYKILGIFPHPGKSHLDVFLPLMKKLAEKGHNVTVLSYYPLKTHVRRYKDIDLNNDVKGFTHVFNFEDITGKRIDRYMAPYYLSYIANASCESGLSVKYVSDLIKSHEKFDVIIAEFFNSDCFLGFVDTFKAPLIGFSSCTIMPWTSPRLGNPTHPAYIPNNMMTYSDKLNFFERVENTVITFLHNMFYKYFIFQNDKQIARKYFGRKLHSLDTIVKNSSLFLVNTHFSLNFPRPLVPSIIEVGGIHIREGKSLPKNIEKWINESSEGVIYFSLGSMIKGHTFPDDKRLAFLKAFSRLPHRVLWKWENETMVGKPDNVMIQKWLPQFDILCHPNVKAFISHGGLLGTIEAVHCGVPVMVMPQFGDQFTNAKALEANGGGLILYLQEATEENIYNTLRKLLSTRFRTKAKELSERFRDRPMPPLDTAVYWVEYVARHRGAPHMRTAAVDMPFYKYYLLDVMAFLLAIFLGSCYLFFSCVRIIVRRFAKVPQKIKSS